VDDLDDIYKTPYRRLVEWNLLCLNWVKEKLEWPTEFRFTEEAVSYGAVGVDDRRNNVRPKNYGHWNPVKYRQVFEERTGFFPNLSILDLLFNTGKRAGELLYNSNLEI